MTNPNQKEKEVVTPASKSFNLEEFIKKTKEFHKGQPVGIVLSKEQYKLIKRIAKRNGFLLENNV